MAEFKGTIREFTKYIGAYCRLKVSFMSAKHKKLIGKCEKCGANNSLESAHVRGHERPLIISNILSQYVEDEQVNINLDEFEERFVAAHMPIEKIIKILCTSCHRSYDNINLNIDIDIEAETENKSLIMENNENIEIEKLIKDTLNKTEAIKIINKQTQTQVNNSNTLFSNINAAVDVWWLEPNNEKFKTGFNFLLNSTDDRILYHFYLPANIVTNPKLIFYQRGDSDYSKIFIPKSTNSFLDNKGFDFKKYLIERVSY